jgi:hypothetical protein
MSHLRDNSGDRSFDKIDLTMKNKLAAHKKRTQSTAENILKNRFPNLNDYNKNNESNSELRNNEGNSQANLDQTNNQEQKWVNKEVIHEEKALNKDRGATPESSDEEKKINLKHRSQTSAKKKFDANRLIKPTYSSMKRGRVLARDPETNHTVSIMKTDKVFSPNNPSNAKKMLERNIYLDMLDEKNIDLGDRKNANNSAIFSATNLNKTAHPKFIPNTKTPAHIKNASTFINSANGFETFLRK